MLLAVWDADHEWVEMRLVATREMHVVVPEIGVSVDFARGEEMRTEISAKFRRDGVEAELAVAGFHLDRWWTDEQGRFALTLARAV